MDGHSPVRIIGMPGNRRSWSTANPDAEVIYLEDSEFFYMKVRRVDYNGSLQFLWAVPFLKHLNDVRRRREVCRMAVLKLWREDFISMEYDDWAPEDAPGDLLGLRRLFGMSVFPGPVKDCSWDSSTWDQGLPWSPMV
ncbi:uncharacterized protein [Venturia canescens]|uniref:uncharacterized protein isoform X2 n=1 Tax=Venturia canescens TaxID=32260 RepID=UPI001C9C93A2|nr:uncharacterized protein LOC122414855 isoform X2 [Venturia canescens]